MAKSSGIGDIATLESQRVKITNNQIIGMLLMVLANAFTLLILKSLSITLCGLYVLLSVAEHLILESANRKISDQWSIFDLDLS